MHTSQYTNYLMLTYKTRESFNIFNWPILCTIDIILIFFSHRYLSILYFFCASIRLILFVLSTNNPCAGENSHGSEMFHSHLDESCITVLHSLLVIVYKSDTVCYQCNCVCVCVCVCDTGWSSVRTSVHVARGTYTES